jgi:MFS family permease
VFQTLAFRFAILTLLHFIVDFYGGLAIPLVEPALTTHLNASLTAVALLVGGSAFIINLVQPLSGWLLPKNGMPALLIFAPLAAGVLSLLGLTDSYAVTAIIFLISAIGIGLVHPEATLTASALSRKREGLGVGFFLSGGYFGFASGSLISGLWIEKAGIGALRNFWVLGLLVLAAVALVLLSGLYRLRPASEIDAPGRQGYLPFGLTLPVSVLTAVFNLVLIRLITLYLVRSFPGQQAQAWGGTAIFTMGISGALAASLWGALSEKTGSGRLIAALIIIGAPFYWALLHIDKPQSAALFSFFTGITIGGVFPLTVVLARRSRGSAHRLRIGFAIGGAWGVGEICFMIAGRYIDSFEKGAVQPVLNVLSLGWFLLAALVILALFVDRLERKHASVSA